MSTYRKLSSMEDANKRLEGRYLVEQSTPQKQQGTSANPLCNSNTGTGGTGTKTPYMVCVWKDVFATYVKLTDTTTGKILAQVYDQDFQKASSKFFSKVGEVLPDKKIGIDLPMPITPDN
jgi:hypothetical protein